MAASASEPLPRLPPRRADSHKGDFGRALLVGGSRGMAGAVALAGMAALRSGAGLVQLAVPDDCLPTVAAHEPSYMTAELPSDRAGRISVRAIARIRELAGPATAVACGPGLGRSRGLTLLAADLYDRLDRPMVLDADALNALAEAGLPWSEKSPSAKSSSARSSSAKSSLPAPRVLTPHPGEFARLLGMSTADVQMRRGELAAQFAARHGVVVVLKGHRTVISDGARTAVNTTGNPGMATGGSGDVLTGVITALVCQGLSAYDAARLGAHMHGLAGDLAAQELGQVSLLASDLLRFLPAAFQAVSKSHRGARSRASARGAPND
jgi:NAD(P)H-hydrate epimerase